MTDERHPIILCGGSAGRAVVFGYVDEDPTPGEPATLYDARMVLRWATDCGGLFGLAANGPAGSETDMRITAPVERVTDTDWKQFMAVSEAAADKIRDWPAFR